MRKLGELSKEELHELLEKNDQFKAQVYDWAYQAQMDLQREEGELMGADVFDYHDHYSSFYLTTPKNYGVRNGWSVAHKLDADYMNEDARKLYEKLNRLADELEEMEADELDKNQDEFEERINNVCDKLAEAITYQLRAYEDVSDEQIDFELEQIADGMSYASDWETDGTTVYQHITKEYK